MMRIRLCRSISCFGVKINDSTAFRGNQIWFFHFHRVSLCSSCTIRRPAMTVVEKTQVEHGYSLVRSSVQIRFLINTILHISKAQVNRYRCKTGRVCLF